MKIRIILLSILFVSLNLSAKENSGLIMQDTLFYDNFNDSEISTKWTTEGYSVGESGGVLKLSNDVTDNGGKAYTLALNVNNQNPIKICRRAYVSYANDEVNHFFNFEFGETANFIPQGSWNKGVVVSYTNYSYANMFGLYIGSRWSTMDTKYVPGVISQPALVPWSVWFDEVVAYDPKTGKATESVNGSEVATVTIDTLSSNMKYARFYIASYGWWTGHTHQMDYLLITQERSNSVLTALDRKQPDTIGLPNPVHNDLRVHGIDKQALLSLLDTRGNTVLNRVIDAANSCVDVAALAPGVYFVRIVSADGSFIRKLIKK